MIVADVNVLSAKSVNAVVPEEVGVTFVNEFVDVAPDGPPEVYVPDVATSLFPDPKAAAEVAAVKEALLSYKAIQKVSCPLVKSCCPFKSSSLKEVHIKFPVKAMLESPYKFSQFGMSRIFYCIIHCSAVTANRLSHIIFNKLFNVP